VRRKEGKKKGRKEGEVGTHRFRGRQRLREDGGKLQINLL
jgi:hypothetical protein